MKKKNMKEVEKIYCEYGLKIIGEYKNVDERIEAIDNEGYKYFISLYHLKCRKNKDMKSGRYNNKNVYKYYNIFHYLKLNNISTKIKHIPEQIDTDKIVFCCGLCGKQFSQLWKNFLHSPYKVCEKCSKKQKKSKIKDINYIRNIFEKAGYIFLDENKKSFGMHYSYYIQDSNGYRGRMLPYTAQKSTSKIERFHIKNKYSIDNINLYCLLNNMDVKCLDNCFSQDKKLMFKCSCGKLFYALWDNVKKGKYRCNFCSKVISNNEQKVIDYLNYKKIDYNFQYNIKDFRGYKNLYFDFYLKDYCLFIEVDGEQHYRPVYFGGISHVNAVNNFKNQLKRDEAKNEYCKIKNQSILRISYKEIKDGSYITMISAKLDELSKYKA